jgi:hypothetical protein
MFSGGLKDVPEALVMRLVEWVGRWTFGRIDSFYMAGGGMCKDE